MPNNRYESEQSLLYLQSGVPDPRDILFDCVAGTLYLQLVNGDSKIFQKQDDGPTANWTLISQGIIPAPTENVEYITLTALDVANGFVLLSGAPAVPANTLVDGVGGCTQKYGADFVIAGNVLSWLALGMASVVEDGTILRVEYFL